MILTWMYDLIYVSFNLLEIKVESELSSWYDMDLSLKTYILTLWNHFGTKSQYLFYAAL